VYRLLRHLEMHGLVTSQWDTAGHGPARRVYQITEAGEAYLQRWVADLRETDRVLHHFLQVYDKRLGRGEES
jgi:PadR family transcriptional regulator PadR